jgi:hypothetical protein
MRLRVSVLAALAALVVAPGVARAEGSANVKQLAQLPAMASAISINFIDDTMYVSTVTGVFAYDVSDPANPAPLAAAPHYIWENEDMSVDPVRKRLFVSRDPRGFTSPATPGSLFPYGAVEIYDVSNPNAIVPINVFTLPAGHTTSCVNRCDFIWTSGPGTSTTTQPADWGGRPVFATDVRDPKNPVPCPDPIDTARNDGKTDYAHDIQVDANGVAWVSGAGGVRGYWTEGTHFDPVSGTTHAATACKPIPYGGSGTPTQSTSSRFMHNSWRDWSAEPRPLSGGLKRNDVLLATEENIVSDCKTSGRFVAYDLRGTYDGEGFKPGTRNGNRMKVLDTWTPEKQPGSTGCDSSHYFTSNGNGITANAFYSQGVRFLDVSNPRDIRQVGYWVNDDSDTWAAYWHKGLVYVADFQRGVEVLQFGGSTSSKTVRAPRIAGRQTLDFSPEEFGGICPLHVPSPRAPVTIR